MKHTTMVSVIILNYKKPEMTQECVEYLQKSVEESTITLEIIVVDNSAPETADRLKEILPKDVILIENETNLGFAAANNQGMEVAKGEYVLLLNNDVFAKEPFLNQGIEYLTQHPDVGIWAPKLVGLDGKMQISTSRLPTLASLVHSYLSSKIGKNRGAYKESRQWQEPREVEVAIGAAMLIPSSVINEIGMLDDDFFFTSEDVEFCHRMAQHQKKIVYDPTVHVVHIGSASQSHKRWVDDPFMHEGRILYFKKISFVSYILSWLIIRLGLMKKKMDIKINDFIAAYIKKK